MKKTNLMLVFALCLLGQLLVAQDESAARKERNCVAGGILQGGGSLVGADLEFLLFKGLGIQAGAGLIGFGAGINYHIQPDNIRTPFLSLQYWHQGV
jgi:hypothetical protein